MRITFVLPQADLSGGVRVVAVYAQRLQRRGHRVTIVSLPAKNPTLRERARSLLRGKSLPSHARQGPSHLDGLSVEHNVLESHRPVIAADVPDADVVVATWWETAEWVAALPASKGAKAYFIQHYEVFPGQPAERVEATWRLPMHKITVARWLLDLGRDRFAQPDITLVPNSVDLEQFCVPPRGKQARPTAGLMYSTAEFKGCDLSLAAFELAARKLPDLRLIAFGSTPVSSQLPLPEEAHYVCRPPQEQIRHIYGNADVWLFGSRSEGFGLPLLEAMACRTPVVASPAGAAPELLGGGGGVLVPPEDPAAMAEAILRVCTLPESDWRAMSDKAHATASRYTWEDATDRFEAALRTAVSRSAGGASPAAEAKGVMTA